METKGFFKNDNGNLLEAENYVINKDYELYKEQIATYTYPIDGWYHFDNADEAYNFFNIEKPEEPHANT